MNAIIEALKEENAWLRADRDSWRDQCSERVKDWDEMRQECERLRGFVATKDRFLNGISSDMPAETMLLHVSHALALTDAQQPAGTPHGADQLSLDGEGGVTRRRVQPAERDPCPQCIPGAFCKTPTCGRLQQPVEQPQAQAEPEVFPANDVMEVWDAFQGREWFCTFVSPLNWDAKGVKDRIVEAGYSETLNIVLRSRVAEGNPVAVLAAEVERLRKIIAAQPRASVPVAETQEAIGRLISHDQYVEYQRLLKQPRAAVPDVDALAGFIRAIDGNHVTGAGVLAEKIVGWLSSTPPTGGAGQ